MTNPFEMSDDTPVYVISVAAQLSGLHPQTLRAYDRMGLVSPGRAAGRGRRYSLRDIVALREVQRLSQEEGVNLSGIKRILELESELDRFRRVAAELTAQTQQLRAELESTRSVAARLAGLLRSRAGGAELVPVSDPRTPAPRTQAERAQGERGQVVRVERTALPAAALPPAALPAAELPATEADTAGPPTP